jgi:uncharacterized protein YndB with AHSA1/START domain
MTAKNNPVEALVLERTFDAPVIAVWKALTNVDEMCRWYFDLKEFRPEPGFEFQFVVEHEGHMYNHRCKITEVIPQKKIAYTWRYEGHAGDSLVTFELFAEGARTKLKLTHEGLKTFPSLPSFARKNFEGGWTHLSASLKDFVENADREIFITREFNAPRELVWEAMTNPKHVVNWWGPRGFTTMIETMDFRVGGVWKHVMRGPDGAKYPNKSIFKEIVKPERIVYSHGGGREEGGRGAHFISTWTFEALTMNKTRVTMRGVFPSAADRDYVVKEFGAIEGGQQTLERLGEYLPKMS